MTKAAEQVSPHALDAERAVLGALMMQAELWPEIASRLRSEHFFRLGHGRTFEAMARLVDRGTVIDPITVKDDLSKTGDLDEAGGVAYLAALLDGVPRSLNAPAYADVVREKARLRSLATLGRDLTVQANGEVETSGVLAERAVGDLLKLSDTGDSAARLVGAAAGEYLTTLEAQATGAVLPTGFSELDRLLSGGLHIETLTIVAGRPGTGKTSWGLQVALEVAERTGPSVFFSLEETQRSLAARAVGWRSRISPSKASARMLSEPDLQQMSLAWQALSDTPLYLQDTALTLMEIAAWCQRLGSTRPLCCVVVDYLQLLATHGKMDRHEAVAVVSRGLKRLAREYHVAVLALSQLNRAPDARQDKRPHLSDLRESGALEQDADVVVLLYRGEMYKPTEANRGIAEAILAKHRAGPTGVVRLAWRDHLAQFSDLAE